MLERNTRIKDFPQSFNDVQHIEHTHIHTHIIHIHTYTIHIHTYIHIQCTCIHKGFEYNGSFSNVGKKYKNKRFPAVF